MDACGSSRRGKVGKCDARLTKLFNDIAPDDTVIKAGKSGAETHAQRLDDVFGALNHTLSGAVAPPPPSLDALEMPAPAPVAPSRRPPKAPRRKANSPRRKASRPPPKPGFKVEALGQPASAAAERGAAMDFLRELQVRRGGGEGPVDDDADDAAPRFRKRPRREGGAAQPKQAAVMLTHLDDEDGMDDG